MAKPLVVDLLRHGAVDAERWAFRGGGTDIALSVDGWQQMERVAAQLPWAQVDEVVSSPMQRCLQPAEKFARRYQAGWRELASMREIHFGLWEGRSWEELADNDRPQLDRFWRDPTGCVPPEGEPFDHFVTRVVTGWQRWVAGGCGHRLLIAHGGVIRVVLAHLLQMPVAALWSLDLPYASWSRVSLLEGHAPRLLFLNPLPLEVSS
ncbi:MAG: histidine phosphatase family protein [Mariprofundales bacterium]|nr:histidine phosphatase family protein [Mariprofundales bacterium]